MRRLYNIVIKNASNVEVYNECVFAYNENEAILQILNNVNICDGDTITIEED